jgi:hypothetical protein
VELTTHLHLVPRSKNEWSYISTSPIRLHGVVLIKKKHRDNFTFTFTFKREEIVRGWRIPHNEALNNFALQTILLG